MHFGRGILNNRPLGTKKILKYGLMDKNLS